MSNKLDWKLELVNKEETWDSKKVTDVIMILVISHFASTCIVKWK